MTRFVRVSLLLLAGVLLVATPVFAYLYRAPVAITENASTSYDMLPVLWDQNNVWLGNNGFMNSTANDTRVQTLGGLNQPWLVADNKTLTAIPIEADSQTNLYFVTDEDEVSVMNIIVGYGGYITRADVASWEPGDNFSIELSGYFDASVADDLVVKAGALEITANGSGSITAGIGKYYLSFTRTNSDWVSIPDNAAMDFTNGAGVDQPGTVIAWVKLDDATSSTIISHTTNVIQYNWEFITSGGDSLIFNLSNLDGSQYIQKASDVALTAYEGQWIQVAATYSGSETHAGINLYLNGAPFAGTGSASGAYTGTVDLAAVYGIGARREGIATFLDGDINSLVFYTSELTPAQILDDYNGTPIAGTEARYILDEGTGNPQDSSGNGHNATANTADWETDDGLTFSTSITASGISSGERTVTVSETPDVTLESDDFEWGIDGDSLSTSGGTVTWTVVAAGTSRAEIDTAQAYAGTRSARLYRDGANNPAAYFTQTAGTDYNIQFRVRKDETSLFYFSHGNGARRIYIQVSAGEVIYYYDTAWRSTGSSVLINTWYLFEVRNINWTAGTYDIYLGNVRIQSGAVMETSGSSSNRIDFSNSQGTSELWIDNVEVYSPGFTISVDGVTSQDGASSSGVSVPGNDNSWVLTPQSYWNYYRHTVGGTLVGWYQPTSMILTTVMPDRAGTAENGVITWGANPAGVGATVGSMSSSGQPSIGGTSDTSTSDILPVVGGTDWRPDAGVSATLLANPMRPIVTAISDNTTLSEYQVWVWFGVIFVVFVTVLVASRVRGHHLITGIALTAAIILMVVWTIFPWLTLAIAAVAIIFGLVSERSPSL